MLPIIVHAAENFCQHQLRLPSQRAQSPLQKRTLIAYIDVETNESEQYRVYIGCDAELLQTITKTFLDEDESDEETLINMLLETTNMIVGSSKVLAQESYDTSLTIATPFFLSENLENESIHEKHCIAIENNTMLIALKRL